MKNIQIFCQYCEDIRKELDGKISLMGVLPGALSIPAADGSVINRICAFVSIVAYPEHLQSALTIQILWNDEILRESSVPDDLIQDLEAASPEEHRRNTARAVINFAAKLDNIKLADGGRLRARVKVDEKYVEAISLQVILDQDQADSRRH